MIVLQSKSTKRDVDQEKVVNKIRNERLKQFKGQQEVFEKLKKEYNDYQEKLEHPFLKNLIDSKGEVVYNEWKSKKYEEESEIREFI